MTAEKLINIINEAFEQEEAELIAENDSLKEQIENLIKENGELTENYNNALHCLESRGYSVDDLEEIVEGYETIDEMKQAFDDIHDIAEEWR